MSTVATRLTVDQFLARPERGDVREELIEGEVIEVGRGGPLHEETKARFCQKLGHYFEHSKLPGVAFPETAYYLTEHYAPMPDISVVLSGKLDPQGTGRISAVPDLAIEVVSSESAVLLRKKVDLYLERGVRAVWVAYPELAIIDVYTNAGVKRLDATDSLEQPDLLPGFSVRVADLFTAS
jgi:Uma2 family endonuclease